MPTEYLQFRSKPILKIVSSEDERIKIQFGQKKANLILQNIDEIAKFANNGQITIESTEDTNKESLEVVS